MLGYKYIDEVTLIQRQQVLNRIIPVGHIYITLYEYSLSCWFILHDEIIAPFLGKPIEIEPYLIVESPEDLNLENVNF